MKIVLQTWFYEGCHIVKDLAIVQQGGILAHVVAETPSVTNSDEPLVWVTWVCSVRKRFIPKITVSES